MSSRMEANAAMQELGHWVRQHAGGGPPLTSCNLDAVCDKLGITVRRVTLHRVHGCLTKQGNTLLVLLNRRDSARRQRFTLAHEVAHLLLDGEHRVTAHRRAPAGLFTGPEALERQCDRLATEILMPTTGVSALMRGKRPSMSSVMDLADRYEASIESAALRLAELTDMPTQVVKWRPEEEGFSVQWSRGNLGIVSRGLRTSPGQNLFGVGEAYATDETVCRPEKVVARHKTVVTMAESKRFGSDKFRYVLTVICTEEGASRGSRGK
jgi:hypothetical protein